MTEQDFIKKLKGYNYIWKLLTEKHNDLPNWLFRQFQNDKKI